MRFDLDRQLVAEARRNERLRRIRTARGKAAAGAAVVAMFFSGLSFYRSPESRASTAAMIAASSPTDADEDGDSTPPGTDALRP